MLAAGKVAYAVGRVAVAAWLLLAADIGLTSGLHDPYDALLRKYVDANGRVAYRALREEDGESLDAYLRDLERTDPSALSEQEQIAFWINAYNARVIKGILEGYSAEGFLGRRRLFSWYSFPLAGEKRTLKEIEHEILRKQYAEPRIHFALVCASTSCPVLRREAYRGNRLEAQLDEQAREFVNDARRNQIGPGDTISISPIFDWFSEDFAGEAGSVAAYLKRYKDFSAGARIEYLDYDWTMNAQPGQRPE